MLAIIAHAKCTPTKTGVHFTSEGADEYEPISGTGTAKLGKDGRLTGTIQIKNGDSSTFVAGLLNRLRSRRVTGTSGDGGGGR